MKKNNSLLATFVFGTTLALSATALSEETRNTTIINPRAVTETSEYKPHFGLQAGSNSPEGSNRTGAEVG